MNGGPSHVDTFDPKPMLTKYHGKPVPTQPAHRAEDRRGVSARPSSSRKYGQSGIEVSEIFSNTAEMIDDICVIRSMHADVPNHEPSLMLMNCGEARQARPSLGSWVLYGLGTENQNLPGFLVMCPDGYPIAETQNWQAAFLPGIYQGTYIDSQHTDIEKLIAHIQNHGVGPQAQRAQLDLLAELNREHLERHRHEAELEARDPVVRAGLPDAIRSRRRLRRQPGARVDPRHVRPGRPGPAAPGHAAAARARGPLRPALARRGPALGQSRRPGNQPPRARQPVRPGHRRVAQGPEAARACSTTRWSSGAASSAARRPSSCPRPGSNQGKMNGRDHNHYGFTMWLAGGGVKGGHVHGATDEFGFQAVENPVHVHDLHATILHLLGFNHETVHLPLRRPRLPPDRRARQGRQGDCGVSGGERDRPVSAILHEGTAH